MSHFAQVDENNIVINILVGYNDDPAGDEGYSWFVENLGGTWIKTSYNAIGGKRRNPNTGEILDEPGFRKNYAQVGYFYDLERDAFIPPKPFDSWILNEDTCLWEAPTPYPTNGGNYKWVEKDLNWQPIESEGIVE